MASNGETPPQMDRTPDIRDELINTAVKFLINPKVQTTTVEQRESFLRGKGLSEREIKLSFERSALQQNYPSYQPQTAVPLGLPPQHGYLLPQQTRWGRIREVINTVAIIGGVVYGLYILYKRYIAPYLFGASKKRSPIEDSISSLDKTLKSSVRDLRTDLQKVQSDLDRLNDQQASSQTSVVERQVREVKSEITSLKGILLNRQQFPAMDDLKPSVPWIPEWQKDLQDPDKPETVVEMSAASAPSVDPPATNGGSDSSLEILND